MKFSKGKRESFSKFFKEVSSNGFKDINKRNEEKETILHQAVEISDYKTVRLLIKKGADVNARDKNGTTLCSIREKLRKCKSAAKGRSRSKCHSICKWMYATALCMQDSSRS